MRDSFARVLAAAAAAMALLFVASCSSGPSGAGTGAGGSGKAGAGGALGSGGSASAGSGGGGGVALTTGGSGGTGRDGGGDTLWPDAATDAARAGAGGATGQTGGATGATGGRTGVAGGSAAGGSVTGGGAAGGSGGRSPAGGATGRGGATGAGGGPAPTLVTIAGPVVKVDFDMQGRPTSEVSEIGYTAWPVTSAASISNTFAGITFTFAKAGANGTALRSDWQKAAIQAPNYARLLGDGLTVDGGEAGAQIQMTIKGLSAGPHSLLAYINQTGNVASAAPIDVLMGDTVEIAGALPSIRALTTASAKTVYLQFDAQAGEDVVILFRAEISSSAASKNVMINGFDLNVPNPADQASQPSPENGDEHVDCDAGSATLSWKAASTAVSHDVYVGDDLVALQSATRSSPFFRGNQTGTSYKLAAVDSLKTTYWRIDEITAQNVATPSTIWYFRPRHLAFPSAEGYGRFARGGRGGVVVHVTNLNDSGPGSLRAAVETDVGPRTVVFDTGGIIKLASRLTLAQSYITVAGQTAPGKGICIRSAPFGTSGAHDVVIQHVRVRLGAGATFDGMGLQGSDHSIVDHCSISWTIDEAFSSRSGKNITLQRTLISEALNVAGHENYPAGTEHGYAGSISGDVGSFHHNLLAHCEGRNWSLAGGLDADGNFAGRLDIFNTVVYNWGGRATDGGAHEVNFVNNYYRPGAATAIFVALNAQYESFPGTQKYYFAGNVMPGYFDESSQDKGRKYTGTPDGYSPWVASPFFPSYAKIQTAGEAFKDVLSDVGCTQPVLDDHDARVVKETLDGTTTYKGSVSGKPGLPDKESDVGGYESYPSETREASWDSDGDGLPDFWEKQVGSNPSSQAGDFSDGNADPDGDGYTRLDDYLQWMAKPHFFTNPGAEVAIDLAQTFVGYTSSPSYSSSEVVNGTVSISGKTATFKATACGLAAWKLAVKDGAGNGVTKEMVAFVDAAAGASCP
ncbi:MAG: T9SS C-terminal target domain-containing protein [Deltaproteobacteria bacterium]|nr:T9SS C-terminal target domain-containing protein [Deltaproteobacteria bacterium]